MSSGKRYEEPRLNIKKVIAVIVAIAVFAMSIYVIIGLLGKSKEEGKIISNDYFVAYKDNKWGIINGLGETVISPSYQEMIVVPNSKKDVFICTYDVDYETGEYKTKAVNKENEEVLTGYEQIEAIQNVSENNVMTYEENELKVKKDGKYGIINLDGKNLLPCEYEDVNIMEGVGYIVKNEEGKYGIIDSLNNKVLETEYDGIEKVHGNDMFVVLKDGKQILIKKDGTEVLNKGYDEITGILKNADNGIIYKSSDKYGIIGIDGTVKIEAQYEDLKEAKTGLLIAKKDGKYGIIDLENETKLEFKYTSIAYSEKADLYIAQDDEYNDEILDSEFAVKETGILIDLNEDKGYLELRKNNEYKYYNFKFEEKKESEIFKTTTLFASKKGDKYGFVDKDGKVVVDYKYDEVGNQNALGYAAVKKDGKWGAIDSKGQVVQEPIYDLEEYLKIDFIGKWHLGKDINMNYYNQL